MKVVVAIVLLVFIVVTSSLSESNLSEKSACPKDWLGSSSGACYFISDHVTTWMSARTYCTLSGSDLTAVESEEEETLLKSFINATSVQSRRFWIGFTDQTVPGVFNWVDGSVVSFTNWNDRMSEWNASSSLGTCVDVNALLNMKWEISNCSEEFGFICRMKEPHSGFPQVDQDNTGCEPDMVGFRNSCYWTMSGEDWSSSNSWCISEDGHLATISNNEENIFVYNLVRLEHKVHWLGLRMTSDFSFDLSWVDGQPVGYSNWKDTTEIASPDSCTVIGQLGKWSLEPCNFEYAAAVCEKPRKVTPSVSSGHQVSMEMICPVKWTLIEQDCYQVEEKEASSWDLARSECGALGGDLASFRSREEELNVFQILFQYGKSRSDVPISERIWIGLKLTNTGALRWSDDNVVTYTNWGAVRMESPSYCVVQQVSSRVRDPTWVGYPCAQLAGYLCKRPAHPRGEDVIVPPLPDEGVPTEVTGKAEVLPDPVPEQRSFIPDTNLSDECPQEWDTIGNKCFGLTATISTWAQSLRFCRNLGPGFDLASIQSQDEQDFLLRMMRRKNIQEAWIGIQGTGLMGLEWTDASPFSYFPWSLVKFQTRDGSKLSQVECISIVDQQGKGDWLPKLCDYTTNAFCEKRLSKTITLDQQTVGAEALIPLITEQEQKEERMDPPNIEDFPIHFPLTTETTTAVETTSPPLSINDIWREEYKANEGDAAANQYASYAIDPDEMEQFNMTGGTIAGIVLGCLLGSAVLSAILIYAYHRYAIHGRPTSLVSGGRTKFTNEKLSFDNALYNPNSDQIQLGTNGYSVSLA